MILIILFVFKDNTNKELRFKIRRIWQLFITIFIIFTFMIFEQYFIM